MPGNTQHVTVGLTQFTQIVAQTQCGEITVGERQSDGSTKTVTRPTRVLDTIENRAALEQAILERAQADGRRAGVDIKEIRLGESAIPPELLLARQREQLAGQLRAAYIQEQIAQEQRQPGNYEERQGNPGPHVTSPPLVVRESALEAAPA